MSQSAAGRERGSRARGLPHAHAGDRVARRHVRVVIGRDHHAGGEKVVHAGNTERPIGDAIGAAVLDLEARRHVVKAVGEDVVLKVPAFQHVLTGDVVVAGDEPPTPGIDVRAGARR